MTDKLFCSVPWTQLEIGTMGLVKPCCEYRGFVGSVNLQSIDEIINSNHYKNVRQTLLDGEFPKGCSQCKHKEKVGLPSRRQQDNEMYGHLAQGVDSVEIADIALLDLKLGNTCNMKCRVCSSIRSSLWDSDEIELFGVPEHRGSATEWQETETYDQITKYLDNLKSLYLSGGEPLLVKKNIDILKECVTRDVAKNIYLRIVTNGSIRVSQSLLDTLKQFKKVHIMYSIDDVGPRFTYQRHPVSWEKVQRNFKEILNHNFLDISITYTASIFNCLSGKEFIEWAKSINFPEERIYVNFVEDPNIFNIRLLTQNQKDQVIQQLGDNCIDNKLKQYMDNESTVDLREARIERIKLVDNLRKENFESLFPQIVSILNA
jgi:MoaA/NifB/PqqE/SkfB family radical SAM enzyme